MTARFWPAFLCLLAIVACPLLAPSADSPAKPGKRGPGVAVQASKRVKTSPGVHASLVADRASKASVDRDSERFATFSEEAATGPTGKYAVLNIEFTSADACGKFKLENVFPFARNDRFLDVFALNNDATIEAVETSEGVVWFEWTSVVQVPPPAQPLPKKETPRDIPDKIVRGGVEGLTGKGVILAVIDSGLDFRHPDFITYDAEGRPTSRLLYLWDVASDLHANGIGSPAPVKFPSGSPIGTIYSRDLLTRDLRTGRAQIPVSDANGHGTGCAGVAAGNGNSNKDYVGVAPGVDLIGIRADHDGDNTLDSVYLLNAMCAWLDEVAGDRPLVISCSWGGQDGGRDGQTIFERHLSSRFPLDRTKRAICIAAGNDGDLLTHAPVKIGTAEKQGELFFNAPAGGVMTIYLEMTGDQPLTVGGLEGIEIDAEKIRSFVNPLTNQMVVELKLPKGKGGLYLHSTTAAGTAADAYITGPDAQFDERSYDFGKCISTPSAASNVLCIGSYDWNDQFHYRGSIVLLQDNSLGAPIQVGGLSTYSSRGPLRFGQVFKPELVAPGQWHSAPAPLNVATIRDTTGQYRMFNGTSAATPYTAGVIALLMEAAPQLSWGQIRQTLVTSVTQDGRTGQCPNGNWGYGKLDYAAVEKAIGMVRKGVPAISSPKPVAPPVPAPPVPAPPAPPKLPIPAPPRTS